MRGRTLGTSLFLRKLGKFQKSTPLNDLERPEPQRCAEAYFHRLSARTRLNVVRRGKKKFTRSQGCNTGSNPIGSAISFRDLSASIFLVRNLYENMRQNSSYPGMSLRTPIPQGVPPATRGCGARPA